MASYLFAQFFSVPMVCDNQTKKGSLSAVCHRIWLATPYKWVDWETPKLGCVIGKLKKGFVCMQSAFLLFCCCDEKIVHVNLSPSSTSTKLEFF